MNMRTANHSQLTLILLIASVGISACQTAPRTQPSTKPTAAIPSTSSAPTTPSSPTKSTVRTDISTVPEVVPRNEPLSKLGNPAFYDVLGERYFVRSSAAGYVEKGIASWYGPGFHQEFTSNGEPYDMYGLTAAHKTLPLPCYVQVTNLSNGKQVILRVNDRGPFKAGRIIDLSYTAAAKLDMLREGTAMVEVRTITPGDSTVTATTNEIRPIYVQAGAFNNSSNANRLVAQLHNKGYSQAAVHSEMINGQSLYRVRIGPVASVSRFDQIIDELKAIGISDAHLSSD